MPKREKKIKTNRKALSGGAIFLIAMLLSFCILGTLFYFFFVYMNTQEAEIKQESIPYISEYQPTEQESMKLFLFGTMEKSGPLDLITVIDYNAPDGIITAVVIPSRLIYETDNTRKTLQEIYSEGGIGDTMNALNDLLGINIEKYLRINRTGISNMTDMFGGLPYNFKKLVTANGEVFASGEQMLDGRRFSAYLFSQPAPDVVDTALQAELISGILRRGMTQKLAEQYQSFVSAIYYNCNTNLNEMDFLKRETGFTSRLQLNSMVISAVSLKGQYTSDYSEFYLSKPSLEEIQALIGDNAF